MIRNLRLLVFAKAPLPGKVKTRLIPRLGADGAAALHTQLVEHTLRVAHAAGIGAVELCCAPNSDDPFLQLCGRRHVVSLTSQSDGDLGARMFDAFRRTLKHTHSAILIGTDCPALTVDHLREAGDLLADGRDAVLGPAEDGGYVLVGLARCDVTLFDDIAWGTPSVMATTRERLRALGWRFQELETLWDVDRPEDYQRLIDSRLLDQQPFAHID